MAQIADKDKYVKKLFNSISEKYDVMNMIMTWGMLPFWQKFMLDKASIKPGDFTLDVCCGTGELALKMSKKVGSQGKVYGLDFSEKMLEVARKKIINSGSNNVEFIQGDALSLPFEDNSFQVVTNGFALRNVVDILKAVKEMARVTKPGGRVVCLEVSRPQNPLLRKGFYIYFYNIVPLIGRLVDKGEAIDNKFPAYTWLPESLKTFPDQEELKRIFLKAGLTKVEYFGLSGGAVTVHIGTKE